jgi:hypothetical protein
MKLLDAVPLFHAAMTTQMPDAKVPCSGFFRAGDTTLLIQFGALRFDEPFWFFASH